MILGCIDIGSNTTRLLVADASSSPPREIAADKVFTRIGADAGEDGTIPAATIERVADVVAAQLELARAAGAGRVAAVATAVVRDAPNGDALVTAVARRTGLSLSVLEGEEEARLSFLGATRTLSEPVEDPVAVVDVGGGSTEIAIGAADGAVAWSRSLTLGSGRLAASLVDDPPSADAVSTLQRHALAVLEQVEPPEATQAFAVGGTATSLRRLVGGQLTAESLHRGCAALTAAPIADLAREYDLDPRRVRLLPAGIAILAAVIARLRCSMRVANGGLREGIIAELAAEA